MIFKVSFKETDKSPSKVTQKVGRTTTVILRGVVELPVFWKHLPDEIIEWIGSSTKVEIYENMANNTLAVYSTGVSKCNHDDKYDFLLGERLAEARAKYQIYEFFYSLCDKLYDYYNKILFGSRRVIHFGEGSCIGRDLEKYGSLCIRESHHIEELLASKENG